VDEDGGAHLDIHLFKLRGHHSQEEDYQGQTWNQLIRMQGHGANSLSCWQQQQWRRC
jgi:hypothetical protein